LQPHVTLEIETSFQLRTPIQPVFAGRRFLFPERISSIMSTAAQRKANRENAQHSSGPTTEAGKEVSSRNNFRHGLCANFQVLSCEDQKVYDDIFERFLRAEQPADDVERELVAKMARHSWLSERAIRCQEACFLVQPQTPEDQKDRANGIALRHTDLEIYLRYQTTHDRAYARASAELLRRRKERRSAEIGFESQKRREAQEARSHAQEIRRESTEKRRQEHHERVAQLENARIEHQNLLNRKLAGEVFEAQAAKNSAATDRLAA
jgi:hypothetical protein